MGGILTSLEVKENLPNIHANSHYSRDNICEFKTFSVYNLYFYNCIQITHCVEKIIIIIEKHIL